MVGKEKQLPVLVGLSGGLDSMVAAYLLRIQKRETYGVIISSTPEQFLETGDSAFYCHQTEARIAAVKKFCDHLQIPLTIVRPREEFSEEVLEGWIAAKAEARRPRTCRDCHAFRMKILAHQMKELECGSIATGHYAKLMRSAPGAPVSVHSSNDLSFDQAGLLASVSQDILAKMELPLSELQRKEVLKIAENFSLHPPVRTLSFGGCLPPIKQVNDLLEHHLPESFRKDGEVLKVDGENLMGRHLGFHSLQFGKPWKEVKNQNEVEMLIVDSRWKAKELLVAPAEYFKDKGAFLRHCSWGEGVDFSAPMKGYIHHGGGLQDSEVMVTPRTLGGAWVTLIEGEESFPIGEDLTVFRRRGKNAKVLLSGRIFRLARHWPSHKISIEAKGENGKQTVEIDKDFNF